MRHTPAMVLSVHREVAIRHRVDVLVAGGGPAGMAAAVTAARQGRQVMLIEGQNCLGGSGTAGMLPVFMAFGDSVHFYAGGFGREVYDRMEADGGFLAEFMWGRFVPQYRGEVLKRLYDAMIAEAGVRLSLVTQVVGVEAAEGRVTHILCAAKSGLFAIEADVVIDCTGDGDVAAWAGAPFEKGDASGHLMPGTLCSLWSDIDWAAVKSSGQSQEVELLKVLATHPEVFSTSDPHLPGILPVGPTTGGGNIGHVFGLDGTDEESITRALVHARKTLPEYEAFYRRFLAGFEQATLVATASLLGVRESRRILGDYVLDLADYDRRATFDDEIGRYNYWIDIHPEVPSPDTFKEHVSRRNNRWADGESYGIPYRILTPRGFDNLLVAGRCVSTDRIVQSSIRVMPGCFITGQAAGMAAALAVEADRTTRGIDVHLLQERLLAIGAFLPNAAVATGTRRP